MEKAKRLVAELKEAIDKEDILLAIQLTDELKSLMVTYKVCC